MNLRKVMFFMAACGLVVLLNSIAFAEENAPLQGPPVEATPATPAEALPPAPDATQMQWLWGEVATIDTVNNQLNVKYLDYETDTEKEILISTDNNTLFENVKSFSEIKPGDNLSIDYLIAEGKNIAKNISCTRPESLLSAPEASISEGQPVSPDQASAPVAEETKALPGY